VGALSIKYSCRWSFGRARSGVRASGGGVLVKLLKFIVSLEKGPEVWPFRKPSSLAVSFSG